MAETLLMIGTRKGLWMARSDGVGVDWDVVGPEFVMNEVISCAIDCRGGATRLLVGAMSLHFGPQVFRSDDLGKTWDETPNGAIRFPEDTDTSLEQVWQLAPGSPDEPDVVYAGTQPSALFRSEDRGETFSLVRSLWDHPHRTEWRAGFGGQAIQTILADADPAKLTVAMSTGGVYRTDDDGAHWHSIADGLPSDFGFPIVVDPHDPDTVYVFPLVADSERIPPEGRPRVWRSRDAGEHWTELAEGLPKDGFFAGVMRDAMCTDDAETTGLYFGSRDGNVYTSSDGGDHWQCIASHLPDVMCVRAAVVPR